MSAREPASTVLSSARGSAFDSIEVPTLSSYKRTRVERARLWRKLEQVSREPSEAQLARFGKMRANVLGGTGGATSSSTYFSMNAVTLTRENQHHIDPRGYFTMKADGVGGLAVWTANTQTESEENPRTSMLFVTRDSRVRCIANVPLVADKLVIMDAEMCLCRKKLNTDEFWRVTNGFNVHERDYLDYYTFLDAEALKAHGLAYDIACDEHQARYDSLYELCCAVFDIAYFSSKVVGFKYADRVLLINDILETDFVKPTVARRKRMAEIERVVEKIGGHDRIPLRLFLKPVVPLHCINSAFHALQPSMYGVRVDGVVLMRADAPYTPGFAPHVLKWKPLHALTVDFTVVRESAAHDASECVYTLCITMPGGTLARTSTHVLDDTSVAAQLLEQYSNTTRVLLPTWQQASSARERVHVLECQPVLAGGGNLAGASARQALQRKLWWRPIEWRSEKTSPNSRSNYEGVCRALLNPLSEDELIALVKNSAPVVGAAQPTAAVLPNSETLVPIDEPQIEPTDIMN